MQVEEMKRMKRKAKRLESEICNLKNDLEDAENELETVGFMIEVLESEVGMNKGDAFETNEGLLGVVLYKLNNLYRVVLRLWNGRYVEDWINPMEFSGKMLEDSLSHQTYCEFRAAGAV